MFCEMSVLDGQGITSASIIADTDILEVWSIDVDFIHQLFAVEPMLSKRFYKYLAVTLAKRLRSTLVSHPMSDSWALAQSIFLH